MAAEAALIYAKKLEANSKFTALYLKENYANAAQAAETNKTTNSSTLLLKNTHSQTPLFPNFLTKVRFTIHASIILGS
jgi:hypothetical protein